MPKHLSMLKIKKSFYTKFLIYWLWPFKNWAILKGTIRKIVKYLPDHKIQYTTVHIVHIPHILENRPYTRTI